MSTYEKIRGSSSPDPKSGDASGVAKDWENQIAALRQRVRGYGGLAVAFSGGVDSTLLAFVAKQELGDRALAVTATSPTYPSSEEAEARRLATLMGIKHIVIESNELEIPGFVDNPPDRCYSCKRELFSKVREVAAEHGITMVADGTNADDSSDYRPGRKAAAEAGVVSPFMDVGMGKEAIRECSRRLGLTTAEKPAYACLASRFPYGERITEEKLLAVEKVERVLRGLEFVLCRVRFHGNVARIEVPPRDIQRLCQAPVREEIAAAARAAGFKFVTLDLEGYRTGSMNATLPKSVAEEHDRRKASAPGKKEKDEAKDGTKDLTIVRYEWQKMPRRTVAVYGEPVSLRPLSRDDETALGDYFLELSPQTRRVYGPHAFDRQTAAAICAGLDTQQGNSFLRLVAVMGGKIVGYFILHMGILDTDKGRLGGVDAENACTLAPSVADEWQNRGLGTLMMDYAKDCARVFGKKTMVLWGGVQAANVRAVHFYNKSGFRKIGEFPLTVHNAGVSERINNFDMTTEL